MPFFNDDVLKTLKRRNAMPQQTDPIKFITSGLYCVDYATGGGFPLKRVTEISGRFSTSKSTLSMRAAAKAIERGEYVALLETENTVDFKWLRSLGIPLEEIYNGEPDVDLEDRHLHIWHPKYLESALETLNTLYLTKKYGVIILDSFGASPVRAAAEATMDDVIMMKRARVGGMWKEKFSAIADDGAGAIIIANQVYTNTTQQYYDRLKPEGGYVTSSGGEAIPFVSSVRIYMEAPGNVVNAKKELIGKKHRGLVHKNKTGKATPSHFEFEIVTTDPKFPYVHYPRDIWKTAEMAELIEKRGHYWFYKGQNVAASDSDLEDKLLMDDDFSNELEVQLQEAIKT